MEYIKVIHKIMSSNIANLWVTLLQFKLEDFYAIQGLILKLGKMRNNSTA